MELAIGFAFLAASGWITAAAVIAENAKLRKTLKAFLAFDRDHDGKPGGSRKG